MTTKKKIPGNPLILGSTYQFNRIIKSTNNQNIRMNTVEYEGTIFF